MDFDWNNVKAFIYTADTGSLSAAARKMRSSQPTVSRQVAAFEESLSTPLFERATNKLLLTPKGQVIYDSVKDMLSVANRASIRAQAMSESFTGELSLAVNQLDAIYRIPSLINEFHRKQPGIKTKVIVSNEQSDLLGREADIAIRNVRPNEENLIARKIKTEPVYFYCSVSNSTYVDSEAQQYKSIGDAEIISFENSEGLISYLANKGWHIKYENIRIASNFQPLHIEIAKQSDALIILPETVGDNVSGIKKVLSGSGPIFDVELWLVCHQELRSSKKIRYFYDFLGDRLSS